MLRSCTKLSPISIDLIRSESYDYKGFHVLCFGQKGEGLSAKLWIKIKPQVYQSPIEVTLAGQNVVVFRAYASF